MANIEAWADQAAKLLKTRKWEGEITFLRVTSEVVLGKTQDYYEQIEFTRQVRIELRKRSAVVNKAHAEERRAAKRSASEAQRRFG
jgi:hypothetical protein